MMHLDLSLVVSGKEYLHSDENAVFSSKDDLQHQLLRLNHLRFSVRTETEDGLARLHEEFNLRALELSFVEAERRAVAAEAAQVPRDPEGFVAWYESLREIGPGQHDSLFPWLATTASREEMRWFLRQEIGGEAGFEDLVALTQIKLSSRAKLELARNYWDEMGRGKAGGMHGPMLDQLAHDFDLSNDPTGVVREALAVGNIMTGLAANRQYTYQSIGSLGVVELTAPGRAEMVNEGLRRLGLGGASRRYFALHATLDIKHSEDWNREVIVPLVSDNGDVAPLLAEGALMRLRAGACAFARYREILGL